MVDSQGLKRNVPLRNANSLRQLIMIRDQHGDQPVFICKPKIDCRIEHGLDQRVEDFARDGLTNRGGVKLHGGNYKTLTNLSATGSQRKSNLYGSVCILVR